MGQKKNGNAFEGILRPRSARARENPHKLSFEGYGKYEPAAALPPAVCRARCCLRGGLERSNQDEASYWAATNRRRPKHPAGSQWHTPRDCNDGLRSHRVLGRDVHELDSDRKSVV